MDFDPSQFLSLDMEEDQSSVYTAPDFVEPYNSNQPSTITVEGGLQIEQDVQIPVPVFDTLNIDHHEEEFMDLETDEITKDEETSSIRITEPVQVDTSDHDKALNLLQQLSNERNVSPHVKKVIPTTQGEQNFRKDFYWGNYERVKLFRLHCTICDKHLGCAPWITERQMRMHKLFNVSVCRRCFDFYGDINFPIEDGTEMYCCWCGEGGEVFCCSKCPKIVCKKCVIRNFGSSKVKEIEENDNWLCFVCDPEAIWPHRALFWGMQRLAKELRTSVANHDKEARIAVLSKDTSHCCLKLNEAFPSISLPRKTILSKVPICLIAVAHQAAVKNQPDLQVSQNSFIGSTSRALNNNLIQKINSNIQKRQHTLNLQQVRTPGLPQTSNQQRIKTPTSTSPLLYVPRQNNVLQNRMRLQSPSPYFHPNHQIRGQLRPSGLMPRPANTPKTSGNNRMINSVQHNRNKLSSKLLKPLHNGEVIDLVDDSPRKTAENITQQPSHDISWLKKGVKDIGEAVSTVTTIVNNFPSVSNELEKDFEKATSFSENLTHNVKIAICSLAKINQDFMDACKSAIDNQVSNVVRNIQTSSLQLLNVPKAEIRPVTAAPVKRTPAPQATIVSRKLPSTSSKQQSTDESEEESLNPALLCETVLQEEGNKENENKNKPKLGIVHQPAAHKKRKT